MLLKFNIIDIEILMCQNCIAIVRLHYYFIKLYHVINDVDTDTDANCEHNKYNYLFGVIYKCLYTLHKSEILVYWVAGYIGIQRELSYFKPGL